MDMKKYGLVFLCVGLLLLSGCQKTSPEDTPEPTPSQPVETSPVAPSPAESSPAVSDPSPLPSGEAPDFPALLEEFNFPKVEAELWNGSERQYINAWLTGDELAELKASLQMDAWREATDLPGMGISSLYTLSSGEEDFRISHIFMIDPWDEETCLVVAKAWDGSESYSYYAPISVLETYEQYLAGKNLLPDFVRYFDLDQVNVDLPAAGSEKGETDHEVYLLDHDGQLSMLAALTPDTWTWVRSSDEPAGSREPTLELLDSMGNRVVLAHWDEEKCLVSCFFTDTYRRYTDYGTGAVAYYRAPASVLKNARDLLDGLTPLGVLDREKERYFDLFWADPGFDLLLDDRSTASGRITDDQMAAYTLTVLGYEYSIDFERGVSKELFDQITQKHFGRKIGSYETDWSKVLPSGNVTATGWDAHYGCYPILTEISDTDEYGNLTATFRVYTLPESLWLDEKLPALQLSHAREYLLTGHDGDYLAEEWTRVSTVTVTFRIETDETYGTQREYVVYDAVRVIE